MVLDGALEHGDSPGQPVHLEPGDVHTNVRSWLLRAARRHDHTSRTEIISIEADSFGTNVRGMPGKSCVPAGN